MLRLIPASILFAASLLGQEFEVAAIKPAAPQDLEPWAAALHTLLTNESAYWREARQSRDAALRFVSTLDVADFDRHLRSLPPAQQPIREHKRVQSAEEKLKALDPAKRALLLARLKQKKEQS